MKRQIIINKHSIDKNEIHNIFISYEFSGILYIRFAFLLVLMKC